MDTPDSTPELQEKDFIHEEYSKNPRPFWTWLFVVATFTAFLWGSGSWYFMKMNQEVESNPFLQVTNREMSVFLWQFSEYMPQHVKEKVGYLPGFVYQDRIGIIPETADNYVVAPPELLFLYHTWDRLLKEEFTPRRISKVEFLSFLDALPEWNPVNWKEAPVDYKNLVDSLQIRGPNELSGLPEATVPLTVRMAFQGWKNYVLEKEKINEVSPSFEQMEQFLQGHPHYARSFWRNILAGEYSKYLYTLTYKRFDDKMPIDKEEITPFLRVAFYNYMEALKDQAVSGNKKPSF